MNHWTRRLFAIAAPLLLTGCLWSPGNFTSDLMLRKDGSFVLEYRGEIVLMLPPGEREIGPWTDSMARCYADGRTEVYGPLEGGDDAGQVPAAEDREDLRPCTAAELARLKAQYEAQTAQARLENRKPIEEMTKAFGLPGLDDESNHAFAAKLMRYAGWRSVAYRGNGVYDVDYRFEGRATQDFLFPALPDNDFVIPFIAIRQRSDGSILVTAPALAGGSDLLASGAGAAVSAGQGGAAGQGPPPSRAQGRLTIATDGEILTNNSEDGPAAHSIGRKVHWDIGPGSSKIPETLIRL